MLNEKVGFFATVNPARIVDLTREERTESRKEA
jgi:hypothetical protein